MMNPEKLKDSMVTAGFGARKLCLVRIGQLK